jgi:hypothetical protein
VKQYISYYFAFRTLQNNIIKGVETLKISILSRRVQNGCVQMRIAQNIGLSLISCLTYRRHLIQYQTWQILDTQLRFVFPHPEGYSK